MNDYDDDVHSSAFETILNLMLIETVFSHFILSKCRQLRDVRSSTILKAYSLSSQTISTGSPLPDGEKSINKNVFRSLVY